VLEPAKIRAPHSTMRAAPKHPSASATALLNFSVRKKDFTVKKIQGLWKTASTETPKKATGDFSSFRINGK